jgi:hypothetical protein
MYHCIHLETEAPKQEVGESQQDPIVDDAPIDTQGRHLSIFWTLF